MQNLKRAYDARNSATIKTEPAKNTKQLRKVRAGYDAAQVGIDDDHWYWADSLNANALNSPQTRKTLREKSRYEELNNSYCGGLIDKLAKDMVGTCPRLQLSIPGATADVIRSIEKKFKQWARSICLGEKLRTMEMAAIRDGEGFAVFAQNPLLEGVQLDLRLYETDQVRTPFMDYLRLDLFDGGRVDEFGNVVEWNFSLAHPGSPLWISALLETKPVPSKQVIQWFKPRRAGQLRGAPEIASSMTLFAYLRRYTTATLTAAETHASIAGVLETDMTPNGDGPTEGLAMEQIPMPRGTLLTVPAGYKAKGFDASQPTTNYPQFKNEILSEAGASVGAPRNIATGSSAEYNYSSARLDHGIYQHGIKVRRHDFSERVLDRIFRAWIDEAVLVPGMIPDGLPLRIHWEWSWFFDGFPTLDPLKEANADDVRLKNGTTNLAEIYAEYGQDWREQIAQRAAEIQLMNDLGITQAMAAVSPSPQLQFDEEGNKTAQDASTPAAAAAGGVQATALNGAQITSLLLIADGVVRKQYPPDAAIALIQGAFPLMSTTLIKRFIEPLANYDAPIPDAQTGAVANA